MQMRVSSDNDLALGMEPAHYMASFRQKYVTLAQQSAEDVASAAIDHVSGINVLNEGELIKQRDFPAKQD